MFQILNHFGYKFESLRINNWSSHVQILEPLDELGTTVHVSAVQALTETWEYKGETGASWESLAPIHLFLPLFMHLELSA